MSKITTNKGCVLLIDLVNYAPAVRFSDPVWVKVNGEYYVPTKLESDDDGLTVVCEKITEFPGEGGVDD